MEVIIMLNNNIRHLKLIGIDSKNREVYKCLESGSYWKNIEAQQEEEPQYYSCNDEFEGEPYFPFNKYLEVVVIEDE